MSQTMVSPLEAHRQPPVIRSPQAVQSRPSVSAGTEEETSDDDDISSLFPSAEQNPQSRGSQGDGPSPPPQEALVAPPKFGGPASVSCRAGDVAAAQPRSVAAAPPKKRKKVPTKKVLHVCFTKYPVIRELADEFNFIVDANDEELEKFDFNMIWSDTVLPLQKLVRLMNWQRTNHFPSMHLLCRKVHLGLTLGRMRKVFPQHYSFYPRTWSMRSERQQFARYFSQLPTKKAFILKPNAGCQGRGIIITRDPLNSAEDIDNYVCQEYVMRPLLIDRKKFDLRVYCLVTSIRNLSIFVYNDGLVRMCAEDYEKPNDENMQNACRHLTNYAVNKHNDNFVFNSDREGRGDAGNKRDFVWLNRWFRDQGHSPEKFWDRVHHMMIKTIIAAQPQMTHVYNSCFPHSNDGYTCFEVLGFDILVDDRIKPILMEVNHTPSFSCDTPLDHRIKHDCLAETWKIIDVQPGDKLKHQEREKAMFARRMQTKSTASAMVPIDSMLSTAQVSGQDQLLAGNEAADPRFAAEQLAAEHRRKEDLRLKNYKRVYPSTNIEKQALYDTILAAAKTASAIPTTASQEQRQQEVRAEREKREQSKRGSDSGRRTQRSAGAVNSAGVVPPQPPSQPASGNATPTSNNDEILPSQPFLRSNVLGAQPPSTRNARMSTNGRSGGGNSNERPKRTKEDVERQRQKLADQMERHRRRMVLGPRLSVFQLREAQLSAMFQDDQPPEAAEESVSQPQSHTRSHTTGRMSAAGPMPALPSAQPYYGTPSSAPGSSAGLSVAGASTQPSHHEQFQAILQQLSRYQHASPEYRFYDPKRAAEVASESTKFDQRLALSSSGALRNHEGLDLGDIEEDDDFGAGGGMYYDDEEEEE